MSSLLRLERKQKIFQIHFEFAYFYFVLIHLELKRQLHSYAPVVPSKTTPDSRPKSAKCIPVFTPKRPQNPTLWGSTYLYGLYKGVSLPLCPSSRVDRFLLTSPSQKLKRSWKGLQFRVPGWCPGGGGRSPLFLDQTEAPRAEKNFMETAPRPTLSPGLDLAMVYLEDTTRGY